MLTILAVAGVSIMGGLILYGFITEVASKWTWEDVLGFLMGITLVVWFSWGVWYLFIR